MRASSSLPLEFAAGGFNPMQYKDEMIANTDFRKFDNVLRMHLDLRRGQLDSLKQMLQAAEDDGHLVYGIHTASETLMTCVVDSYQGSHAHLCRRCRRRLRLGSQAHQIASQEPLGDW
ncbi:MAG: DUF3095 domain-containing protein [Myxococcales bacterium]|nr:DUF3095 domain-containing protein [Myxococcales bacterium]